MPKSRTPQEILQKGLAILAEAGEDPDRLECALTKIHSALERHFRLSLLRNNQVPEETHMQLSQGSDINWRRLLALMREYSDLSWSASQEILRFNGIRNAILHEGQMYTGGRRALEQYAHLADTLINGWERAAEKAAIPDSLYDTLIATLPNSPHSARPLEDTQRHQSQLETPSLAPKQRPVPITPLSPPRHYAHTKTSQQSQASTPGWQAHLGIYIVIAVLLLIMIWRFVSGAAQPVLPILPTPTPALPSGIHGAPAGQAVLASAFA